MSVEFAPEPAGSRAALADGLNALRVAPTPASTAHIAAAVGAQTPPPLPVHFFPLDQLAANKDPRNGSPVSWTYLLVTGNQPVRTAEVIADQRGGFTFASISSAHAAETANAIRIAETAPATAGGLYELRLALVPALYVTALWLKDKKGNADYFIVIPPAADGFQSLTPIPDADFLKSLQAAAAQKTRVTPPQTPASATN
jgi:hypothetical protein